MKTLTPRKFVESLRDLVDDLGGENSESLKIQRELLQLIMLSTSLISLGCSFFFYLKLRGDWTVLWANFLFFGMGLTYWGRGLPVRFLYLDAASVICSYGAILWIVCFLGPDSGVNLSALSIFIISLMMFFPRHPGWLMLSIGLSLFAFFSPYYPFMGEFYGSYRVHVMAIEGVRPLVESTVYIIIVLNSLLFSIFWTSRVQDVKRQKAEKEYYVRILTHDLKAPIVHSLLALRSLKMRGLGAEREIQQIETAQASAKEIINNVENMDLSALVLDSRMAEVRLQDCLDKILPWLESRIAEKKIVLVVDGIEAVHVLRGHFESVTYQILLNLLTNAIKFSPRGGRIVISTARRGNRVEWRIQDGGTGVDEALLETMTQPQLGTMGERGSGLGLKIIRQFAELNSLHVSWARDNGTLVTIRQAKEISHA